MAKMKHMKKGQITINDNGTFTIKIDTASVRKITPSSFISRATRPPRKGKGSYKRGNTPNDYHASM